MIFKSPKNNQGLNPKNTSRSSDFRASQLNENCQPIILLMGKRC
jgi:hypothetical protein